jgi:dihydropyrimidinase
MPTALVRNGRVVTASESYEADLYVDGGKIALVGQGLSLPADTVIDASGCLVLPGGIDVHTHLDLPAGEATSADDFETGTRAAAFGGTTTVVDFATPEPGQSLLAALDTWRRKAEGKAVVDYGFHMALREVGEATLAEMARLTRDEGVTSFKLYLAYPPTPTSWSGTRSARRDSRSRRSTCGWTTTPTRGGSSAAAPPP